MFYFSIYIYIGNSNPNLFSYFSEGLKPPTSKPCLKHVKPPIFDVWCPSGRCQAGSSAKWRTASAARWPCNSSWREAKSVPSTIDARWGDRWGFDMARWFQKVVPPVITGWAGLEMFGHVCIVISLKTQVYGVTLSFWVQWYCYGVFFCKATYLSNSEAPPCGNDIAW